ncbi:hypothetical protein LY76DRAFT_598995 [Colletotrichum caudatum]|nr:hypothetical protein LY76DRAFT_598995 [Colletotrichum caudatum]
MVRLVRPPKPTATNVPVTLPEDEPRQTMPSQSATPDSDPNLKRMTVAQLRVHLRHCSIRFPSQANKAELVRLVSNHHRQPSHLRFEDLAAIVTPDRTTLDDKPSQPTTSTTLTAPADLGQDADGMTVLQLRQYLQDCAVRIPPGTRKAQLVQIAKEHHARAPPDVQVGHLIILSAQLSDLSIERAQTTAELTTDATTPGEHIMPGVSALPNIPNPTDDISYLQPGFDPAFLTVPKLRNLLAAHQVMYAKAKNKADLVRLFEANIIPRAAATIQAMGAIERTDEGIIDA